MCSSDLLDLDGVGVEGKAQAFDKLLRECGPCHVGVGHHMRVVIAHRAVDLAKQLYTCNHRARALQAMHDIGDFLAQRRG